MSSKNFCPFINSDCKKECMFHTTGGIILDDNFVRNCLIVKLLKELPDGERQEKTLESILSTLKNHL